MPEAFGSLAISLASGYSLPQAMRFVGARSAEPIRTEFMRVSFAVNCGVPATEALDAMLQTGAVRSNQLPTAVADVTFSALASGQAGEMDDCFGFPMFSKN